ncbi:MAG: metal ABC transporter ATP-binding protein [Flavobacteriales bacterium]
MSGERAIEVHDLTVTYHRKPALWDVDLELPQGALVGVIGPNGSGKSTFLKSVMGLVEPSSGWVKLFDRPLDEVRHKVSYVPQRESVDWDFPTNVMDVVLMGRYGRRGLFRRTTAEDRAIATESLERVGMLPFAKRQISELSGGQQQRVFLARALAEKADIYLMDEPFAGVDAATENAIFQVFETLRNEGRTLVVVHHDLQSAARYFDWIVLLNTRLVACGPIGETFTDELLAEAYGGKLHLLSQIHELLEERGFPIREKGGA